MLPIVLLAAALAFGSGPVERMTPEDLRRWLETYELETYELEQGRGPDAELPGDAVPDRGEPAAHPPDDTGERARERSVDRGPQNDQLFASALVCYADDALAAARAAIRAEKATAKSSGVANLTNLVEQKVRTERAERAKVAQLAELHEKGLRPVSCGRPDVAHFVACMRGMDSVTAGDWCDDSAWREFHDRQDLYAQVDW